MMEAIIRLGNDTTRKYTPSSSSGFTLQLRHSRLRLSEDHDSYRNDFDLVGKMRLRDHACHWNVDG
jgi:hypothetical protein